MFYDILDKKRLNLLPFFKVFKNNFYLAGGTALALQIGHRDSVDFDFFTSENIDTKKLFSQIKNNFKELEISKIQEEENTLSILIEDSAKISFFNYPYRLINTTIDEENLVLASIEDIGCMKLSAICGRASNKDYIDLYYIINKIPLKDLLNKASEKLPDLDTNLILKSLVYFEDVVIGPIRFRNNNEVTFNEVKKFLKKEVKKIVPIN